MCLYIPLFFVIILCLPRSVDDADNDIISGQYAFMVQEYNEIKKAEHSELKPLLLEIIDNRLQCYSKTSSYSLRLKNCRKEYIYQMLRTAREQIKAAPNVGEFVLCIRDCPLAFSFCNAEETMAYSEIDCREIEALCIETCLDNSWRGAHF